MVVCSDLVTDEMADCIVQLHCMTGCDANSGFYGKGKKSVYDRVAQKPVARQQLSQCGDSLDLEEEVLQELFKFTRHVIYGDRKSSTMAEARAVKWKSMKNKSFIRLPPDEDSLHQHCLGANYLAYLVRHPSLKHHPMPIGHGWELVDGRCLSATQGLLFRIIYKCQNYVRTTILRVNCPQKVFSYIIVGALVRIILL